jgi:hypothetical protein
VRRRRRLHWKVALEGCSEKGPVNWGLSAKI